MYEVFIIGDTLPEVYHRALLALKRNGEIVDCPDWNTRQKEVTMTMVISHPLKEPMISKCFVGGWRELEQYRLEMLDGILDFEVDHGNWTYTYHLRMKDQLHWVMNELKRNPESRRAVIDIRTDEDMGSDDPACMQHIQFLIRNGKLDMKVLFRSNDACKASFMNMFALICLQERMAKSLGVEVGCYTHRANSFHCYEKDFGLLDGYCKRIDESKFYGMTYRYKGEWDELMEDSKPEILEYVEKLKEHKNENTGRK